jgi:hypothetical protein
MSKVSNGLAFARVTSYSKTRAAQHSYSLSNGTTVILKSPDLCLGEWYFFHLRVTAAKHYAYISHHLVSNPEGEFLAFKQKNLEQYSDKAVKTWQSLKQSEKAILAKTLAGTISGVAAAGFLVDAATTIAVEGLTGLATGGLSLIFGASLGIMSAISWEDRAKAVEYHKYQIDYYLKTQRLYTQCFKGLLPDIYRDLDILDPELESLVLRMKKVFTDFSWADLAGTTTRPLSFNMATA